jgi:YfiH family protein
MLLEQYRAAVKKGFEKKQRGGVVFFTIPSFDERGFRAAFSSRIGGVSGGCYESLNFSLKREGSPENMRENFKRISDAAGFTYESIVLDNYEHGCGIYKAELKDRGKGLLLKTDLPKCDALIVDEPGITAATLHADCVPLFYLDLNRGVACVAHAGWRGVYGGLPGKIIEFFEKRYESDPQDILAAVGPHICAGCYEVGEDLAAKFEKRYSKDAAARHGGKAFLDLEAAILKQFMDKGIAAENVTVSGLCTSCCPELFYSHRRDKGKTGAMASLIAFNKAGDI